MVDLLLPHNWLLDQLLPKDDALVAPFQTLLDNGGTHANDAAGHHEALVIEVAHDDNETLMLFTQEIVDRHLDILELHKRRCGSGGVGGLDLLRLDTLPARDQEHREAFLCPAAGNEVVREHAVRDPFPAGVSTWGPVQN